MPHYMIFLASREATSPPILPRLFARDRPSSACFVPVSEQREACEPERCGNLTVSRPFGLISGSGENGCAQLGFQLHCTGDIPYLGYYKPDLSLQILDIFYSNASLLVSDIHKLADFSNHSGRRCHVPMASSASKVGAPFSISGSNWNLVFYDCTKALAKPVRERAGLVKTVCQNNTFVRAGGRYDESRDYAIEGCTDTAVTVQGPATANYSQFMKGGFILEGSDTGIMDCPPAAPVSSAGTSTYITNIALFDSIDFFNSILCDIPGSKRTDTKILLIVLTSAAAALLFPCIYVLIWHRKGKRLWFLLCKKTSSSTERNYEAMIVSYGSLAPKRYMYSEVMKITSSRSDQLGRGGYGVVFKGRLHDGRLVAVKFLHDCKGNGDEFVNEVMSIGRTSHVNVVRLHGFCLEGSKQALIYEYMSNGSLDKYIYSKNPKETLGWERLYEIAIGIARGLEYLHHSCNTRIVHFDIKPQNILLDKDFSPKIADFGLAKLCLTKESKLSMTGTRGTIGFIAPEVHYRTFGVVSTKSDVYSYGMMLLEMVGRRRNVKSIVEKSSEKYFPDWIYEHFAQDDGLQACEVTSEIEEIARKMIVIGLWCIQVLPVYRPTITKVLEMFERSLDDLDMPPKQNFCELLESSPHNLDVQSASSTGSEETSLVNLNTLQRFPTL
ncbi:unnamed protein product [Alopecurus aequalis]